MQARVINILLCFCVFLLLWAGAEAVAALMLYARGEPFRFPESDEHLFALEKNSSYGYVLKKEVRHLAVKQSKDGVECYRARYQTDHFGRRKVGPDRSAESLLLLFGCSVTFGEGIDDDQTLQWHLGRKLPERMVYNYAVHGYGPSHALAKIRSGEVSKETTRSRADGLYVLIPDHVSRVIGDTRAYWIYSSPYFYHTPNNALAGGRSFWERRPLTTALYASLSWVKRHSPLLSLINFELPERDTAAHLHLTADILIAARRHFREQFDGEFFVVFHPSWNERAPGQQLVHRLLKAVLSEAGVPVLDYSADSMSANEVVNPRCDLHPGGRLNERLASLIARDLSTVSRPAPDRGIGAVVLTYHQFTVDPLKVNEETVLAADFEKQMMLLKERGYRVLSLGELRNYIEGRASFDEPVIALTLDDGWKNQRLALPILRALGFKTSFAVFPGLGIGWDYFEWGDVKEIDAEPLFEVFSHTMSHPWDVKENLVTWIDGRGSKYDESNVLYELEESKRVLEAKLGRPVEYLAWPAGWYNDALIRHAAAAGYRGLFTIEPGVNLPGGDVQRIKRIMVDGRCTMKQFEEILTQYQYPDCSGSGAPRISRTPYGSKNGASGVTR